MRQLGGYSPEPPQMTMAPPAATEPSQTDVETESPEAEPQPEPLRVVLESHEAQQPDPYPVEVHRIERQFVDPAPAETTVPTPTPFVQPSDVLPAEEPAAAESAPEPVSSSVAAEAASAPPPPPPSTTHPAAERASTPPPPTELRRVRQETPLLRITEAEPEPNLASGRWEEFRELPRREFRHGGETKLDARPPIPLAGWGLDTEHEPARRSRSLKVALVIVAILIAVGAVLWGGYLRDRLNQQEAQMSALEDQNRKLAESLVSVSSAHENAAAGAPSPASEQPPTPQPKAVTPLSDNAPVNTPADAQTDAKESTTASAPKQSQEMATSREGVSHPLPQSSAAQRDSRRPVDANYHPEIVPPYPTLSQSQNPATASASTNTAPKQQAYGQASNVRSSGRPAASSSTASAGRATSPRATGSSGTSRPALVSPSSAESLTQNSSGIYSATSNGMYASALAQNIEAVESLQRQSPVPLREFHARAGAPAQAAPGVTVSVQPPDQAHGSYGLVVSGGGTRYQLRGHVNSPLAFTDNFNHRVYELVVLQIAGGEAYGYIRSAQQ